MWWLLACSGKGVDSQLPPGGEDPPSAESASPGDSQFDPPETGAPHDSGPTSPPSGPALRSPAEAEDLDEDPAVLHVELTAAPHTVSLDLGDQTMIYEGYAYNGQVPGPTLRAKVGDEIVVELSNQLDMETTIHWHGLAVPWEMDGVAWQSAPVGAGERFTYRFTAEQAGTFWYHPHFNTDGQVSGGLYGVLVVEDPAEPEVDHEWVLVIDDWSPPGADRGQEHLEAEGPWTVNGLVEPVAEVPSGESLRVRLLNAASAGYLQLEAEDWTWIAGDQGLLPQPQQPETLLLPPGDRAELMWSLGEDWVTVLDHPYTHRGGDSLGEPSPLFHLVPDGSRGSGELPELPYPDFSPSEDPGHTDWTWVFSGSPETGIWMMNGEVFPDVTIPEFPLGEEGILEIRNLSPTEHPYHLHGMHFEVLTVNGEPPQHQWIEDTINVPIHGSVRLLIRPTRPGDWMSHCHILPHAEGGMMSVLRVPE